MQVPALPYNRSTAPAPAAPPNSTGTKKAPPGKPSPFALKHSNSDLQVNCNLLFNSYISSPPTSLPPAQHDAHAMHPQGTQSKDQSRQSSAPMDTLLPASTTSMTSVGSGDASGRRPISKPNTSTDAKSAHYMHVPQPASKDGTAQQSAILSTNSGIFIERASQHQLEGGARVPMGGVEPTGARRTGVCFSVNLLFPLRA